LGDLLKKIDANLEFSDFEEFNLKESKKERKELFVDID
jgi:hypothetical protein